jgi:hypothetical protein
MSYREKSEKASGLNLNKSAPKLSYLARVERGPNIWPSRPTLLKYSPRTNATIKLHGLKYSL